MRIVNIASEFAPLCKTGGLADVVSALTRALARVARIAENPRDSVGALKRALNDVRAARRGAAPALEREAFAARWGGPDHRAAIRAFETRK